LTAYTATCTFAVEEPFMWPGVWWGQFPAVRAGKTKFKMPMTIHSFTLIGIAWLQLVQKVKRAHFAQTEKRSVAHLIFTLSFALKIICLAPYVLVAPKPKKAVEH
jgi:hypothetical protein